MHCKTEMNSLFTFNAWSSTLTRYNLHFKFAFKSTLLVYMLAVMEPVIAQESRKFVKCPDKVRP